MDRLRGKSSAAGDLFGVCSLKINFAESDKVAEKHRKSRKTQDLRLIARDLRTEA